MCFLSKTLATINKNVSLNIAVDKIKLKFPFNNCVAEFFKKYEFKTLLNKPNLFIEEIKVEEQKIPYIKS